MEDIIYNGATDTQTVDQKAKNYKQFELVTAIAPAIWVERDFKREYPIRNQNGSGECVVMTNATEDGIIFKQKYGIWMDFSSSFLYQQRKYPLQSGCCSEDIYDIFPSIGNVYESFMPSQNMSDEQAMAIPRLSYYSDIAKVYSAKRIELPLDFETVASTHQATGKGIMVWFHFSGAEWTNIPQVLPQPVTSGHSVTVVDAILQNGKKYLVIQDSWGLQYAMNGYRLISEEYFYARCFLASYKKTFLYLNPLTAVRPKFNGTVSSAKDCLKYETLFPANADSNNVADNVFRGAVSKFQLRYNIVPTLGNFGPITQGKLREVYY